MSSQPLRVSHKAHIVPGMPVSFGLRACAALRLSFSLAGVNFKLRNEGSYLGLLWYILNPLALFLIILYVRQEAFSGAAIPYYPAYLLSGLLMFNLFTQIISASITSISSNAGLIKSIKIPIEALVISKVLQFAFSHIFEMILLCACMSYVGLSLFGILPYALVIISFLIFIAGLSFLAATLGTYVSDLHNVWLVISQLLFFATPIFYVPREGSLLYAANQYNPLYYFMKLGREALIPGSSSLASSHAEFFSAFLLAALCSALACAGGLFIFEKYKARFAERV